MKFILSLLLLIVFNFGFSQNNIRVFSAEGELFTLTVFDSIQNKIPQANMLLQSVFEDTVKIKIEFVNKPMTETVLYLYEKGKPTKNKEFNYKVGLEQNKLKISFAGYYDIIKLPNPLVPVKPIIDTLSKYKNTRLGHFCELKENKPIYYNNIPKDGVCKQGMPREYLNYTNLLMVKAQVVEDKFIIAENVCRNNCLTVEQLNFILKYINFEIEKLKIIRIAYFNLADKKNNRELEKSFRFESSVTELNSFFKTATDPKTLSNVNCKTASSDTEISKLLDNLNAYVNNSQKFETFKKLYSEYCYSKAQILNILKTFIHDREKLDTAKMLYFRCTEKEKFLEISDVFSYNETKSDLIDFVEKQKD